MFVVCVVVEVPWPAGLRCCGHHLSVWPAHGGSCVVLYRCTLQTVVFYCGLCLAGRVLHGSAPAALLLAHGPVGNGAMTNTE